MVLAAHSTSPLTGRPGGSRLFDPVMATDKDKIRATLFSAAPPLDEKKVGSSNRNSFVRPAQFYLMAQETILLNKDFSGSANIFGGHHRDGGEYHQRQDKQRPER